MNMTGCAACNAADMWVLLAAPVLLCCNSVPVARSAAARALARHRPIAPPELPALLQPAGVVHVWPHTMLYEHAVLSWLQLLSGSVMGDTGYNSGSEAYLQCCCELCVLVHGG